MTETELIELFKLGAVLAPIAGEQPAGADLRQDYSPGSLYFRMRDARSEAREAERQAEAGDEEQGASPTQWRIVQSLATEALSGSTKDLEVAAWLTEALVRTAGLRGLAAGAAVVAALAEGFWDGLFPTPDEDGIATLVGPITGLSGQGTDGALVQPLRRTVLFRQPGGASFSYWQFELSLELSSITAPERRQQRLDAGVLPFEQVEQEAQAAGAAHWTELLGELQDALAAWEAMTAVLDGRAGLDGPSTTRVRDLLRAMRVAAQRFAPSGADAASNLVSGASAAVPAAAGEGHAVPAGAISGREDALRRLGEIAAWFRQAEPNSPLAYTLEEAVRRGRMSWPDLLVEIAPDSTTRNALLTSLGIKPPEG